MNNHDGKPESFYYGGRNELNSKFLAKPVDQKIILAKIKEWLV